MEPFVGIVAVPPMRGEVNGRGVEPHPRERLPKWRVEVLLLRERAPGGKGSLPNWRAALSCMAREGVVRPPWHLRRENGVLQRGTRPPQCRGGALGPLEVGGLEARAKHLTKPHRLPVGCRAGRRLPARERKALRKVAIQARQTGVLAAGQADAYANHLVLREALAIKAYTRLIAHKLPLEACEFLRGGWRQVVHSDRDELREGD
mmetsp:Transcript_57953/g.161736  ORF Transcript_57953/g.161736 Transcript_57953/m.161736 type:complete len:205 (+) Transcript_57953:776-1390(+)